ncbi:MAG: LssY C-terminal domain-containing protein [Gammaproteobacteria bacterium]|nr:LssY C-terminal domain-containing protein [Gammaproteobacteria bacterium]
MFESMNIQPFLNFFHMHPHLAGIGAFFIVFCEAMAVIGVIMPGSVTMTAVGIMIGSGVIPAGSTFAWAIAGAIIGDELSYLLGIYFKGRLHKVWPFKKHPKWLERSEHFFHHHGGKSIIIGRFVGPLRAMIPMVAGMLKFSQIRFLLAAIPSASVWAVTYMLPGVLLGALSQELPPKVATQFVLWVLFAIAICWLIAWLLHLFITLAWQQIDLQIRKLWQFMQRHTSLRWFTHVLSDPREPVHHLQLTLLFLVLTTWALFIFVLINITSHGFLTFLNKPILNLLTSIRGPALDHVMLVTTLIGDEKTILGSAVLLFIWLVWKKYWYIAFHWLALVALSAGTVIELKHFIFSPRPNIIQTVAETSSFPSGHTALSIALFGFLAVVIARELPPNHRKIPYIIAVCISLSVGLSRIYLGAHWFTDVIGSIFLGLALVILLTLSYRRSHSNHFSPKTFITFVCLIFFSTWLVHCLISYKKQMQDYTLVWPMHTIMLEQWETGDAKVPLYRSNRFGYAYQPFNIQWIGDLSTISQGLLKQKWQPQPVMQNFQGIIRSLSTNSIDHHLPLFPQLYHNRPPVLVYTLSTTEEGAILILRLWQSDISFSDSALPLWIGTIEYHRASHKMISLPHIKNKIPFVSATDFLAAYLTGYKNLQIIYPENKQPPEVKALHWDGKILLILPNDFAVNKKTYIIE